jgi:hypothetical protein
MMQLFEMLAEQKIQEAIARGELDGLPGAGKPLEIDDDPLVPEDQRVAYRVLKNAGFAPPEVEARKEVRAVERQIDSLPDGPQRARALRRLQLLNLKLAEARGTDKSLRLPREYYRKVLGRLG